MVYTNADAYDDAELWQSIRAVEFLNDEQFQIAFPLFQEVLDGVRDDGLRPQDNSAFWDFLDFMGMDAGDFAWDEFREWYDAT